MTRKLMICPWFGPLPDWWESYNERLRLTGCDFLFDHDLESFRQRAGDILGVRCPIAEGGTKIQDYRPAFGALYLDELDGYDWWGHTDLDCVYARIGEFVTEELLAGCDIQTDSAHDYIAGPWAQDPDWIRRLEEERTSGWVEQSFTEIARDQARLRVDNFHDYRNADLLEADGDRLLYAGREISFFHFRYTKRWPL